MLTGCRGTLRAGDIGRSATPAHGRTRPLAADSFDRATLRGRHRDGTVDDAQSSCGGSAVVGRRSTAELASRVQPCHTTRSGGTVDGVRRRRTPSPVTRRPRAGTAPRSSSRKMGRPAGDLLGRDVRRCPRPDRTVSALDRFREDQIPRMMLKKPYPDRD